MALDSTTLFKGGSSGIPATAGQTFSKITISVDCSATNLGTTDTYKLFTIPAGTYVACVFVNVLTAEGSTCTADIGDSGSATQYQSNTNINSVAMTASAYTTGKGYGSADYLVLHMDNAASAAKFTVTALVANGNYIDM